MNEIYDYLITLTDITDKVGTRIYPITAPADVEDPYLVYFIVSKDSAYQHSGRMALQRYMVQISVYGKVYHGSVRELADSVIAAMDNLSGQQGLEGSFQEEETLIREEETGYIHIPLTFAVWK